MGATPDWWCVDPSTYGFNNMTLDNTTFKKCSLDTPVLTIRRVSNSGFNVNTTYDVNTFAHNNVSSSGPDDGTNYAYNLSTFGLDTNSFAYNVSTFGLDTNSFAYNVSNNRIGANARFYDEEKESDDAQARTCVRYYDPGLKSIVSEVMFRCFN